MKDWLQLALVPAIMLPTLAEAADAAPSPSMIGALAQALIGLLVVLALLYGFFWFLRRFGPAQSSAQGAVKVVGGVMLGPRERLVVVEVRDTWLLVGVAAGHVSALHVLPKPEGESPEGLVPDKPLAASFSTRLTDLLSRPKT